MPSWGSCRQVVARVPTAASICSRPAPTTTCKALRPQLRYARHEDVRGIARPAILCSTLWVSLFHAGALARSKDDGGKRIGRLVHEGPSTRTRACQQMLCGLKKHPPRGAPCRNFLLTRIGFDLDGTLLDTFRDLGSAVNHALVLGGFHEVSVDNQQGPDRRRGQDHAGPRGRRARWIAGRRVSKRLYKAMLAHYERHNVVHTAPYPGVREALGELAEMGVRMAVVTNKFEGFARSVLSQLDLIGAFDAVIGGDSMGRGEDGQFLAKPHPAPVLAARTACRAERFVFIGDSSYDVRAARGSGRSGGRGGLWLLAMRRRMNWAPMW